MEGLTLEREWLRERHHYRDAGGVKGEQEKGLRMKMIIFCQSRDEFYGGIVVHVSLCESHVCIRFGIFKEY